MATVTDTLRYATTVIAVGALVAEFREHGMLVLFAEGAPTELHELCALHRPSVTTGGVAPGDVVRIDGHEVLVTAVGDRANDNLVSLGHVSLKADGLDVAPLPGDICVQALPLPPVSVGSTVQIVHVPGVEAGNREGG